MKLKVIRNAGHQYISRGYIIINDRYMDKEEATQIEVWTTSNSRKVVYIEKEMDVAEFINNIVEFLNMSLEIGKSTRGISSIFRRLGFQSIYRSNGSEVVTSKKRQYKEQEGWLDKEEYKHLVTSIKHRQ